jgi:His-Xaa-Ser system radical SAM maturase HxsC
MRRIEARCSVLTQRQVMRYASCWSLPAEWRPGLSWLVPVSTSEDIRALSRLHAGGLEDLHLLVAGDLSVEDCALPVVRMPADALEPGDVVAITPGRSNLQVLYRESDMHHTVFLTNRCNSRCLMCSQPPTPQDDSWLVEEAKQVAAHIRRAPSVLGFTGGEPLLLGAALRDVLEAFGGAHPDTRFEVLTNGRGFSGRVLAECILAGLPPRVSWMVPLYGHADFLHDHVVQAEGAFDQTIDGLLTLHAYRQSVQLRIVLIRPVLEVLPALCEFIARNLPFVREVALMGCEPIGYALANRDVCKIDLVQWHRALATALRCLTRANVPALLMNVPLCALPSELYRYAHRSISDWKRVYAPECDGCTLRQDCCGLFASAARGWRPTELRPMREFA